MRTRALLLSSLAATAIALGACGEDEPEQSGGTQAPPAETQQEAPPATTETTPPATDGATEGAQAKAIADKLKATGRPKVAKPSGDPPTDLQMADV